MTSTEDSPDRGDEPAALYATMVRIRTFETELIRQFKAGAFGGFLHTSIGQEAVAAGVCGQLGEADALTATHRSHGHLLARGVDMNRLAAEVFWRTDGLCGGLAGHVHMGDLAAGVVGGNGILGANQAIGVGLALARRMQGLPGVVVSFFGEGAANEGIVSESFNLAAVWGLPVLFACEANGFAQLTTGDVHSVDGDIARRAQGFGVDGVGVDGTDVEAVRDATAAALDVVRRDSRPMLVQLSCSRWDGHYEGDPNASGRDRSALVDPLLVLRNRHPERLTDQVVSELEAAAATEVEEAMEFARSSPEVDDPLVRTAVGGGRR